MRWLAAFLALTLAASPVAAREWQVRMLNRGEDGRAMVFAPEFLVVQPGDTVRFLATDRGHNAESIAGMIPAGATAFRGRINEEIVVRFSEPGLYGYKCLPHLGMGMVGLIQVGRPVNRAAVAQGAARLPGLGKRVMLELLGAVR
jgi:pseudoazurin